MPKMKSHRGASKRFKRKKSGLIKRSSAMKNHILNKKTTKRLRKLRKRGYISKADTKRIGEIIVR